jgi:hypothetical protein
MIMAVIATALGFLFPLFNAVRHPTPSAWLATFYAASTGAAIGVVLLFCGKLPQYRAGIFFRFGSAHLPPRSQRLYRLAYVFIVASCLIFLMLLMSLSRVG